MVSGATVLTMLGDPQLADSVDRIAAAAGTPVIRRTAPGVRSWSGAAAVVLDEPNAHRCVGDRLPRRTGVFLVGSSGPTAKTWETAVRVGAQQYFALPAQEAGLVAQLSEVTDSTASSGGRTIAVIAGRGGGGASVFAAALAWCAGDALLIDLDVCGGGIDLLVGLEDSPGLRWPDLRLQDGRLAWKAVRQALPGRGDVRVLSGSRAFHEIERAALSAVAEAGRRGGATVVCDVPRQLNPVSAHVLDIADLVVVITSCDVRGIAAGAALAGVLRTVNSSVGLVVRGPAPGGLGAEEAAQAIGLPLIAAMRPEPGLDGRLEGGAWRLRRRSPLTAAARAVLAAPRLAAARV